MLIDHLVTGDLVRSTRWRCYWGESVTRKVLKVEISFSKWIIVIQIQRRGNSEEEAEKPTFKVVFEGFSWWILAAPLVCSVGLLYLCTSSSCGWRHYVKMWITGWILNDDSHSLENEFQLLPSGWRSSRTMCRTKRCKIIQVAITHMLILCVQFVYLMYFICSGSGGLENCLCPSTANQNYLQVQLNWHEPKRSFSNMARTYNWRQKKKSHFWCQRSKVKILVTY